jgi:Ca2+-binding RTX toxin-like protein
MICGDGRCNENIALTAVHQVFHSEHNRLAEEIKQILLADTSGVTNLADWQIAALAGGGAGGWNGERLFQAARFVTEMEYQHLVFEEFARKIQPLINPFEQFALGENQQNPAIVGEFAHAVYRFGHSMLTEDIGRKDPVTGASYDVSLFDGFLNPAEYFDTTPGPGQSGPVLSTEDAAGGILMGVSDIPGQEIDEFVTDTLRNRLVGLPLDLPVLNLSRGREQGIPRLNDLRRQIFGATQDDAMVPYTDWVDFGQNLKYAASLTNFVAAYGTHPSITAEATVAGKREAARLIAAPETPADFLARPADSDDFMFGTGTWTSPGAATITGVDDVDLWMGGLAERTNLFGGHLGNTFNYVFEYQLTTLQDDDRFYYLARTPGMNLQAQLEGNSFVELVQRNTSAHTLKTDAFSVADCKFEVSQLTSPAVAGPGNDVFGAGSVNDVPDSDCNENHVLLRMSNGTWRYRLTNLDDPPGLNAQIVMNGTAGVDRMWGGVDSDTFWGNEGNDVIEGGDGGDMARGGDGNDIITDSGGDDVHMGGPGNDYISGGPGLDLLLGGAGKDFINGGSNINETFAGTGDDFVIAGTGADLVIAGAGDDWIEGGTGPDLLVGDASSFFFDDHDKPGNDIFIGQTGDDDYDAEGGDDVMVSGPGLGKNSGVAGFDWIISLNDPDPANVDLTRVLVGDAAPVNDTLDRFDEVEGASGWNLNDILRGTDFAPKVVVGAGDIGCNVLDQDGLDRIVGLDALVTSLPSPAQPVRDAAVTRFCNIEGDFVWGEGEILIGGAGSDILEGRGDNDILDGDRYMNVRLSVRTDPTNPATEIGTTGSLTAVATAGNFGPGTAGKTLATAVQNGLVDPGKIVAVREILIANDPPGVLDTAVFSGPIADYTIQPFPDGRTVVTHTNPGICVPFGGGGGGCDDGTDTLRNIERLQFSDTTIETPPVPTNSPPTGSVTIDNVAPIEGDLLTATQTIVDADGINAATMTFTWQAFDGLSWITQQSTVGVASDTFLTTNAVVGMPIRVVVTYLDNDVPAVLESVTSAATAAVINVNDVPTGAVILSDPTPQEGVLLSADASTVADADGISGGITLQWQRSGLGGGGAFTDIAGATGTSFTPTQNEVNRRLRVQARFTDDHGTAEVVASAQTIVTGDLFIGTAGPDIWVGTAGDDIAFGLDGVDDLRGQNGNDIIDGGNGDDTLRGGAGIDTFRYTGVGNGFDAVIGGTEADTLEATADNTDIGLRNFSTVEFINGGPWANVVIRNGAAGNTLDFTAVTITNVVAIDGGGGTDTITGSDLGADNILGGAGADRLNGLGGDDTLTGGTGADIMNGGAGNDTFVFAAGFGADTINGFDADPAGGQDLLDVRPLGINGTLTGVTIAQVGLDTRVTIGANSITLVGIAAATVDVTDFITL